MKQQYWGPHKMIYIYLYFVLFRILVYYDFLHIFTTIGVESIYGQTIASYPEITHIMSNQAMILF